MYGKLVEKCFNTCCNDFTSKSLSSKEVLHILLPMCNTILTSPPFVLQELCVNNCAEKFMKGSERVSARFAEMNAGPWLSRTGPVLSSKI